MLVLLAVLACEPFGPGQSLVVDELPVKGEGRIRLEPDHIDFGDVSVLLDGTATATFRVTNTEGVATEVVGLDRIAGDDDGAFHTDAPAMLQLGPHEEVVVQVTFTPETSRDYSGDLFPNGQITLALAGHGAAPVAALWPDALDLGAVPVGCDASETVQLVNMGDEDLVVDDAALITDTDFQVEPFEPVTLPPGAAAELSLSFSPEMDGLQASVLHVTTNDPATSVATLDLSASAFDGDLESETFAYTPSGQTDILIIQDASATVTDLLADAVDYTQGFLESLEAAGVDWQVSLVREGHDCLASPYPWLKLSDGAERAAESLNTGLLRPGNGSAKLLEGAVASLERTDPGDCLDGFLRQDAQLHTILVSDRTENSASTAEDYIARMAARLQDADDLVISALMGHGTNGCEDLGQAQDAVDQTGGVELDLCDADWGSAFGALAGVATSAVQTVQSFTLTADPVVDTLEVWSGGRELTAWSYDADGRRLTVHGDDAGLESGAELTASYVGVLVCSQ